MIGNGVERQVPKEEAHPGAEPHEAQDRRTGYGPPHPLDGLLNQVRELVEYANLYVEARKDRMRATTRSLIWKAGLGLVGALAAATVVIVAVVFLMSGIAGGLGRLFGEQLWLGELATALAVFIFLVVAAALGIRSITKKSRERTIKKYERRQQQQRERFGHSATDRAQELRQAHRG